MQYRRFFYGRISCDIPEVDSQIKARLYARRVSSVRYKAFLTCGCQLFPPVSLLLKRADHLPVLLHVYDCPAFRMCFVKALIETADAELAVVDLLAFY